MWPTHNHTSRQTTRWIHLRRAILNRDNHTCTHPQCSTPANEVDHINRHGPDHPTNLRALCHQHHNAKTQAEANDAKRQRAQRQWRKPEPHPADTWHNRKM